jgi:hypothetical protein
MPRTTDLTGDPGCAALQRVPTCVEFGRRGQFRIGMA